MQYTAIFAALALASATHAHMEMSFPPPLRSKYNTLAIKAAPGKIDYSMTAPLSGAAQFPCKGYQTDMSDTTGAGASVVTWAPGAKVNFTIVGGAPHGGGSCQAALSYDQGKTFNVIHSYLGNCPTTSGQNFDLTIPSDAKTGAAMFAWTWFNQIGNREIYMNCASITIGAGAKRDVSERDTGFSSRPSLFVANLANGCTSVEGKDVNFPNPGPDVTGTPGGDGTFTGTCAAVNGVGGASGASSGSSGSSASAAAPPASSAAQSSAPAASSPIAINPGPSSSAPASSGFVTAPAPSASPAASSSTYSAPASSGTATSGSLTVSTNGQCSGSQTCVGQTQFGQCCSKWGYCGATALHCGDGCQAGFGTCGSSSNSTVSGAPSAPSSATPASVKIRGFHRGQRERFL